MKKYEVSNFQNFWVSRNFKISTFSITHLYINVTVSIHVLLILLHVPGIIVEIVSLITLIKDTRIHRDILEDYKGLTNRLKIY